MRQARLDERHLPAAVGREGAVEPYEIAAADCVVLGTHALTLEDTGGGGGAAAAWVLHVRCLRDATPPAEPLASSWASRAA